MIIVFDRQAQRVHAVHPDAPLEAVNKRYPGKFLLPVTAQDTYGINWYDAGDGFNPGQLAEDQDTMFAAETHLTWSTAENRWELDQAGRDYWLARYQRKRDAQSGFEEVFGSNVARSIHSRADGRQFAIDRTQGADQAEILDGIRMLLGDLVWAAVSTARFVDEDNDNINPPKK